MEHKSPPLVLGAEGRRERKMIGPFFGPAIVIHLVFLKSIIPSVGGWFGLNWWFGRYLLKTSFSAHLAEGHLDIWDSFHRLRSSL